jgi:DNA-binding NarL/FixJ family response regulator
MEDSSTIFYLLSSFCHVDGSSPLEAASSAKTAPIHTVLLVDDDERVRRSLRLLLRWSGIWEVVGEAADSASALDLVAALHPDLVLLDRWLSDGDGLHIVPLLLALDQPPRIVLLSAEPEGVLQSQAQRLGALICLDKMTPPLELLEALRELVA